MVKIERCTESVTEMAEREYARSLAAQNRADIEYIAMMCDVELDSDMEVDSDEF